METNRHSNARWFWGEGWSRFGAFAVAGGILLWTAHALFPQFRWSIAIFAVLLMAAFGYSERQYKEGQEDRLGDDLYYLGLTYTLVSVVHALYAFTGVANIDRLVSDFSVALLSTLVGIVGRVLLYEKHASQNSPAGIDDGIVRLLAEIEGAVQQMQEFRRDLALNIQQAGDNALQSVNTAFASFTNSAKQMSEAANGVNASLRKGASAFDKSFTRVGDASHALGERVGELAEGTKALGSVSEALNRQIGSLNSSVEQQSSVLMATLGALKNTTSGIGTELDSLKRPVSLLAGSIGEVRQQIDAAKQEFSSAQLKATIAAAGDAAETLRRNLRSVADAVSPASVDANFSVLKKFADAITDLTAKVEDCIRNLASLAERPDQRSQPQSQYAAASNDGSAQHDPRSPAGGDSSSGAWTNDAPPDATQKEGAVGGSSTSDVVGSNIYSSLQDNRGDENREIAQKTRGSAWWPFRRD